MKTSSTLWRPVPTHQHLTFVFDMRNTTCRQAITGQQGLHASSRHRQCGGRHIGLLPGSDMHDIHAGRPSQGSRVFMPAAGTDSVAEGILGCCRVLLERCPPYSSEQLLELLDRFANIAGLPGKSASEEVTL